WGRCFLFQQRGAQWRESRPGGCVHAAVPGTRVATARAPGHGSLVVRVPNLAERRTHVCTTKPLLGSLLSRRARRKLWRARGGSIAERSSTRKGETRDRGIHR